VPGVPGLSKHGCKPTGQLALGGIKPYAALDGVLFVGKCQQRACREKNSLSQKAREKFSGNKVGARRNYPARAKSRADL
jgi:hypothetical protein